MVDVFSRVLFTILFIHLLCTQRRRGIEISSSSISYNENSEVFETTTSHKQHLRLDLPHFSPPRGITRERDLLSEFNQLVRFLKEQVRL